MTVMGSFFSWLKSLLQTPREPYVPGPGPFRKLDLDALRLSLKPEHNGRIAGQRELPASSAQVPDAWEIQASAVFEEELNRSHARINDGIDALMASVRQFGSGNAVSEIRRARSLGVSEIKAASEQWVRTLRVRRDEARAEKETLDRFREEHSLRGVPRERGHLALTLGLLALAMALEAALNATLFAEGSDFGLVGGIAQALIFSAMNVVVGFAIGRVVLTQFWHRSPVRKAWGGLGLAAGFGLAIAMNLTVGHFRDAATSGVRDVGATALATLRQSPFELQSLQSWALLVVGLIVFIFAAYKGFSLDDPYPGFGPMYRRYTATAAAEVEALDSASRSIAETCERRAKEVQDLVMHRDMFAGHRTGLLDKTQALIDSYDSHCKTTIQGHRMLIQEYRDANRAARTTAAPAYFDRWEPLEVRPAPSYTVPTPSGDPGQEAAEAVDELVRTSDAARRTIQAVGGEPENHAH